MNTKDFLYNAVALSHISKNQEMTADLNKVLFDKGLTVEKLTRMNWLDFLQKNADEVMGADQTWFWKEWVEKEVLMTELIERMSNTESLLTYARQGLPDVDKIIFPVEWKKVRMISLEENKDQPQNKALTVQQVKKLVTPTIDVFTKEMIITTYFTDKLLRQSVIDIWNYVVKQIYDAYEFSAHNIILNWDTDTTSNNINCFWNDPATTLESGLKTDVMLFDWARKQALNKNATVDATWNLDLSLIRAARAKMWMKWLNPKDLVIVPDVTTYYKILNLTQAETIEKFGDAATVKNWVIQAIDWIKIMNREELLPTNAAWQYTWSWDTAWQILIIHIPSMLYWYTYGLNTEMSRYAEEKTTWITWSIGIWLAWNDYQNNVQPTSVASLIYNI